MGSRHHIILAEDEVLVTDILSDMLEREGFRVTVAYDGTQALEADARDHADVLVTDLAMPRMDGKTLIQRLRSDRPGLPVVVMTGCPPPGGENELRGGTDGSLVLLLKPVHPKAIIQAVTSVLEH